MINSSAPPQIEPFFFGSVGRRLYGAYHLPAEPARDCGLLICNPIGQEYVRSHRACLNLAQRAAQAGFAALRFDYSGAGDSAGDDVEANLDVWKDDIRCAMDELCDRSGVGAVCLAGLRFGASLAAAVASERRDVAGLVLWDPVVDGAAYLEQVTVQHQETIWRFLDQPKQQARAPRPRELLGFPIGDRLYDEIAAVDLLAARRPYTGATLIVESHTGEAAERLRDHLQGLGARVRHQHVPSFTIWAEDVDKGLVPGPVIQGIIAWLDEVQP
jgi:alpha/beta superfamily hydrolase